LVLNASRRMVWNSCSSIPWMNSCSATTINMSLYGRWFVPPKLINHVIIFCYFKSITIFHILENILSFVMMPTLKKFSGLLLHFNC
jgi:hypothetical protein